LYCIVMFQLVRSLSSEIRITEYNVAINPGDIFSIGRHRINSNVEQSLLLPKNGAIGNLYQHIGIIFRKLELAVEGKLDSHERKLQVGSKKLIV